MTSPTATTNLVAQPTALKGDILPGREGTGSTHAPVTSTTSGVVVFVLDQTNHGPLGEMLQRALDQIQRLYEEQSRRPLSVGLSLYDVGTDEIGVRHPIPVVLHETDDEALARWPEVRAFGIGSTAYEAIRELKRNIVSLFNDLHSRPAESLGAIALDTLRTLDVYLRDNR